MNHNKYWGYEIRAYWGPRYETARECGVRYWQMLETFAAIHPAFSDWQFAGTTQFLPMPDGPGDRLEQLIDACISRDDDDEPDPAYGYWFGAGARPGDEGSLTVHVRAGSRISSPSLTFNAVEFLTRPLNPSNAAFITFPIFRQALLAIVDAWNPTWCAAYPWDISAFWPPRTARKQPMFRMAWMTYLSPRFAPMVTSPASAIVERPANGGLLMIATDDERFDIANPQHIAVARDIEAALAPVNALPWPPELAPEAPPNR